MLVIESSLFHVLFLRNLGIFGVFVAHVIYRAF